MIQVSIYALIDPCSGQIKYVGRTANPHDRYLRHCRNKKKTKCGRWVAQLRERNIKPEMLILETNLAEKASPAREVEWITYYRTCGFDLTNEGKKPGMFVGIGKSALGRFWAKVDRDGPTMPGMSTPCHIWIGKRGGHGHGQFGIRDEAGRWHTIQAGRWLWKQVRGDLPDDIQLDHLCKNPPCVNLVHLEPVTHKENLRRGDSPSAQNTRKTHCPHGHPYVPENTYWCNGQRICRTCSIERAKAYCKTHRPEINVRLRQKRAMRPKVSKSPREACRKGHRWTPENEEWFQGARHCRQCRLDRRAHERAGKEKKPHWASLKAHCPRGHAYDATNTYLTKKGARSCRTCTRDTMRERRAVA